MAAAPARAFSADKRGALPWGDRTMPPAPNAWGSSSLLSLKKGEGSGSFVNINDRPSTPGSSSTSTDESDLLDSPVACGRTSHDSVTAISRPQSTELRSGSWKFPHSQISFLDVPKAPLRTIAKKRPTSHGKGFTICAEDFPVLDSKNSQSNDQQGYSFQGRPSFSSVVIAARDEQRKVPLTGGDPVSTANFSKEPEQAPLHATQTPDICMPPPCIDYWHPPPDHPPDRNGICLGGVVSYGPCKPADKTGSFPVESFTHDDQSLLNLGGEERHGPHRVYHPENNDSYYAHVPVDTYVKSLPHLVLEMVKDNHSDALEKQPVIKKDVVMLEKIKCLPHLIHRKVNGSHSDALEKQPVIKKDVALLEKIKCLNIKARNLRIHRMPEISSCIESMVERPESLDLKADHVANDVPFSAATSYITSAFDMANSISERSNHVLIGTSNMFTVLVTTDLSEGHVTEFSEATKMGKSADNHVYEVADTSTNLRGSSATDTASNIWGDGWKEHSTVYSLLVTTTSNHEDQQFAGNCSQPVHARTANDLLNSPDYEIQDSRRELSAQNARQLQQEEREKSQQKEKSIAKLEDCNRYSFVQSQNSDDAPGKPADSDIYGGWNAMINKLGCAEDIPFNILRNGWEGHPAVDSSSVMTSSHQDQSFPWSTSQQGQVLTDDILNSPRYEIELSRRELSAQHPKQLQEEERGKLQQKAKANAKLEELNRCSFAQNEMSNDVPLETNKNLCKQNAGSSGTSSHDTSTSDTCCIVYTENLNVPPRPNSVRNTAAPICSTQNVMRAAKKTDVSMLEQIAHKTEAYSHDSSALEHLHREGQVHKQDSISRGSTPASDTADANKSPLIPNTISPVKNTEIKIMEQIDPKGVSLSNESRTPMHLQMEERRRQVHSHRRILRSCTPASRPAGVNKGSFIHNVIPSARNNENSMMEHIAWRSASQSHENSSPKRLQMENRRRQVHPLERVLRERSNIAESTEDITTVPGTHVNARNAEAKPHVDLSTQSENRSVSPCMFGTENIETSGLRKAPVSGVVINSSIITVQAALTRGFTVGSIMLGDASVPSVNQEKTVAKEVDYDATNSCASPKQTKQSGKNQHDEQHAKDPHGGDSIMCTEVKEPSKKERPEAGRVNCMALPVPNQPSGNQSTVLQDAVPAKTSEMEWHSYQPEYKELHLQNPRQMLQAEKHTTSSDNSLTSILETKSYDQESLHTSTATKSEIKTEPENQGDQKKKISKHLVRSIAASDEGSTNGSATLASDLTEQEANSLVLKIMQELSDQLEQIEKQLDSTHVVAVSRSEPTQTVSLPGYTWREYRVSHSQRQYHVDGHRVGYAANVCGFTQGVSAVSTAHVLPGSISVPEDNALSGSSTPVWMWDPAQDILTSDMGSGGELTESIYGVSQMNQHCMQVIGGMPYEAAPANPEIQYHHADLANRQVNQAWFPHSQQDMIYHSSSGTGVYWPQMDVGAAMQCHGVTGSVVGAGHPGYQLMPPQMDVGAAMQSHCVTRPVVGAGHPGYQLMPVASPGAGYTGSTMAAAWTWGAAYDEHVYYA
ncbi:hypothetical protein BDA96_05G235400 [Sorghum bicolor]|uniref:Uncharacterized protein n=1 Tax=Sorghum bicolor TaxID=4558 RepID=A0A921R1X6_SORBI|nr:hypothetical protein BDA96_05G235400 [Sorghum bicolor]